MLGFGRSQRTCDCAAELADIRARLKAMEALIPRDAEPPSPPTAETTWTECEQGEQPEAELDDDLIAVKTPIASRDVVAQLRAVADALRKLEPRDHTDATDVAA